MRASLVLVVSGLLAAAPRGASLQEPEGQDPLDRLVEDLGAEDAETRDKASEQLKKRGEEAVPHLKKAAENPDAESALRAREILIVMRRDQPGTPKDSRPENAHRVRLFYQNWVRGIDFQMAPDGSVALTVPETNEATGKREFKTYRAPSVEEFKRQHPELARSYDIDGFLRPPSLSPEARRWWSQTWSWLGMEEGAETGTGSAEHDEFLKALDRWYAHHRKLFVQTLRDETRAEEERRANGGDGPRLGVLVGAVGPALQIHLALPEDEGILVVAVLEGSLAEQAGLRRFDILLNFDGVPLPSEENLKSVVEKAFTKDEFAIEVIREGKRRTLTVNPRR